MDVPGGATIPIDHGDTGGSLTEEIRATQHRAGVLLRLRPWAAVCLVVLVLSGGLEEIAYLLTPYAFWAVWICALALMVGPRIRGSRVSLVAPARWFIVWMCLYCAWTVTVSPVSAFQDAAKEAFHAVTCATAIGVVGKDRVAWQRLARLSALAIVVNVALSIGFVQYPALYSAMVDSTRIEIAYSSDPSDVPRSRLSGLWNNPNEAGRQTLILLAIATSVPGPFGLIAWIASGWMVYLSASRTATYSFLLIGVFHFARWAASASWLSRCAVAASIAGVFAVGNWQALSDQAFYGEEGTRMFWERVLDPMESRSNVNATRFDVVERWLPYLERAPWYGYGYNAAHGSRRFDLSSRTDLPYIGVHNMFLGMWADGGLVLLATFVGLLTVGIVAGVRAPLDSTGRLLLMSLWTITFLFSMFAHSLHLTRDGQVLLLLLFCLPAVPLFRREPRRALVSRAPRPAGAAVEIDLRA